MHSTGCSRNGCSVSGKVRSWKNCSLRPCDTPAIGTCQWQVSVIVLCHTRELAFQIKNEYTRFAKYMPDVRVNTFYGGTPVTKDIEVLRDRNKCPHIVVGTSGRLRALILEDALSANRVKHFVLDECDKMLEQLG